MWIDWDGCARCNLGNRRLYFVETLIWRRRKGHLHKYFAEYQPLAILAQVLIQACITCPLRMYKHLLGLSIAILTSTGLPAQLDSLIPYWRQTSHPTDVPVTKLASYKDRIFSGTAGNGVYISNDNGANWVSLLPVLPAFEITDILAGPGNDIYVTTAKQGVFRSSDGGNTWREENGGLAYIGTNCIVRNATTVYLGTIAGLYAKALADTSWTFVRLPMDSTARGNNILSLTLTEQGIVAGGTAVVFVENKWLNNWTILEEGLQSDVYVVKEIRDTVYVGTAGDGIFFISSDGRSLQNDLTRSGTFKQRIINHFFTEGLNTLTIASGGGIVTNKGTSLNDGLDSPTATHLIRHGNIYFVATATNGVYTVGKRSDDWLDPQLLKIDDLANSLDRLPATFDVIPIELVAYPNPTAEEVTIEANLPETVSLTVNLIAADGKISRRLFGPQVVDGGQWKETFKLDDFPPGNYVISLNGQNFRASALIALKQ